MTTTDTPPSSPTPPPRRRSPLSVPVVLAATVLALTVAVLVYVALGGTSDDNSDTAGPASDGTTLELTPVDQAPASRAEAVDLTFVAADGTETTLRDRLDGRPMVVNFFASWCPPCIREMPDFETVADDTAGRVDIVGLAVQDRPEDAQAIVEQTEIDYFWGRDVRGDIAGAIGVVQMPSTFFVDADGDIVHVQSGSLDADELRALIAEHLGVDA